MIREENGLFRIDSAHTSCLFRRTDYGQLEQLYYGPRLPQTVDAEALSYKRTIQVGSQVDYREESGLCLDMLPLEWSGIGVGDYRRSPMELILPDGGYTADFRLESFTIEEGTAPMDALPTAYAEDGAVQTLVLTLAEASAKVKLQLYYTCFYAADVLARRVALTNEDERPLTIRRLYSYCLDLPDRGFSLLTLDGCWSREAQRHEQPLREGRAVIESNTGASSNRHNPAFALLERGADEERGLVYGFNLLYSGNHQSDVELTAFGLVRVTGGISPQCFQWTLKKGERFETPQAVLCVSDSGLNGLSQRFHHFIQRHVVRGAWRDRERPVLFNNWEATFFAFNEAHILRLARESKKLGAELFVLDDGWFRGRNSDKAGLGDYETEHKKLPHGVAGLGRRINAMGLQFGLWVEPEMVSEDSALYRAHPDWALGAPDRAYTRGRHQLVLDLSRAEVRDYLAGQLNALLDAAPIAYVKWDMNRHISDAYSRGLTEQGQSLHRYILGLYELLHRVFDARPELLLESCSSGGNRFDLGMLCFSPQIWVSDDTDPIERLRIQGGLSVFYPPSVMGAHVSEAPHQQTLRDTPLSTRFAVSCFGLLGYELDLTLLSPAEKREIRDEIAYYKARRRLFQFGVFHRARTLYGKTLFEVTAADASEGAAGLFTEQGKAAPPNDTLTAVGLQQDALYRVEARKKPQFLRRFGGLIKHVSPVKLRADGAILRFIGRHWTMPDGAPSFLATGALLSFGIPLDNAFMGTGWNDKLRLTGDFGAELYHFIRVENAEE